MEPANDDHVNLNSIIEFEDQEQNTTDSTTSTANDERINPLLNPIILENIFSHVPRSCLETACCVNKSWRREANRIFYKRETVVIRGRLFNTASMIQHVRANVFRRCPFHVLYLHAVNFELVRDQFCEMIQEIIPRVDTIYMDKCQGGVEVYQHIMSCIATHLTSLELLYIDPVGQIQMDGGLSYYSYFPIYDSPDLAARAPMRFPSLKQLKYSSMRSSPTLLSHVIQACPNLIFLTITGLTEEDPTIFESLRLPKLKSLVLEMLTTTTTTHHQVRRRTLPPNIALGNTHIQCLMALKLNLTSLTITNIYKSTSVQLLTAWLDSMSSTLIGLHLTTRDIHDDNERPDFSKPISAVLPPQLLLFPTKLQSLREATIWKPFIKNITHVLNSIPNCIELNLPFHPESNWAGILPNAIPLAASVKFLQLQWIPKNIFSKFVLKAFPDLTSLTLGDCNEPGLLSLVFSSYTHSLKWLTLESGWTESSAVTDEIMTGYPKVTNINATEEGAATHQKRITPYVGQLKKLKGLCLNNSARITIKSIQLGLIDCPELCFLAVKNREIFEHFKEACLNIGLQHSGAVVRRHDSVTPSYGRDNYGYNYFINHTKADFWDDETPQEFIERVSKLHDGFIRKLYLEEK